MCCVKGVLMMRTHMQQIRSINTHTHTHSSTTALLMTQYGCTDTVSGVLVFLCVWAVCVCVLSVLLCLCVLCALRVVR